MFNTTQPNNFKSSIDQSPHSPQTRPFNLPINSFKSYMTNSPTNPNQIQVPGQQQTQSPTKLTPLI